MMKRNFGAVAIATGLFLGLWIAFNLFVERQPGTERMTVVRPILLALTCIGVGWTWLTGARIEPSDTNRRAPSPLLYGLAATGLLLGGMFLTFSVPLLEGQRRGDFEGGIAGTVIGAGLALAGVMAFRTARR